MGLRKGREDNEDDVSLYSEDIFEIQISGPHVWRSLSLILPQLGNARAMLIKRSLQSNLAFIDTPGLIASESLGPYMSSNLPRA